MCYDSYGSNLFVLCNFTVLFPVAQIKNSLCKLQCFVRGVFAVVLLCTVVWFNPLHPDDGYTRHGAR